MGDYLKEAYLLAEKNWNIVDEYQKLSDKYKKLELSHNRKEKLLKRTLDYLDSLGFIESDNGDFYPLYDSIFDELNNPLYCCRERSKR